jgi:hypothetical protein
MSLVWDQIAVSLTPSTKFMHEAFAKESEEEVDNGDDAGIGQVVSLLIIGQEMSLEELERVVARGNGCIHSSFNALFKVGVFLGGSYSSVLFKTLRGN